MTLYADAMSNPITPSTEPPYIILVRKLILLILISIVATLGLVMLLRLIRLNVLLLAYILSDAAMGLIAGFSVRWILRRQTIFLRIISIVFFVICGLELLGWFTGWQFGLAPLRTGRTSADWFSLGQIILAAGIATLTLYAWAHPTQTVAPAAPRPNVRKKSRPRKHPAKHPQPASAPKGPEQASNQQVQIGKGTGTGSQDKPKRKRAYHHKPQLHLSAEEEHRCPYCLELIVPDDPRGTVECKICHTLHHADCWAITGTCQVPHYTA